MILLVKDPKKVDHPEFFRNIACSNTSGKMFWSVLCDVLMEFLTKNRYIDTNIQKGFVPGLAGCVEHNWTLFEAFRNAKKHNRTIVAAWYDPRNAYGSLRHNLIPFAIQ